MFHWVVEYIFFNQLWQSICPQRGPVCLMKIINTYVYSTNTYLPLLFIVLVILSKYLLIKGITHLMAFKPRDYRSNEVIRTWRALRQKACLADRSLLGADVPLKHFWGNWNIPPPPMHFFIFFHLHKQRISYCWIA